MLKAIVLILGLLCFQAAAYADCGSYDQLVQDTNAVMARFNLSDPAHTQCGNKPNEAVLSGLISCFEGVSWRPVRTQSEAYLHLSALYGAVTLCYRSGAAQLDPGKKSFFDLVAATQVDPTFELAWLDFSDTIIGMKQQGFFQKVAIQMGLGISIDDEAKAAVQGLSNLPTDAAVAARLAKLRSLSEEELADQY